jgi:hypothetical protein
MAKLLYRVAAVIACVLMVSDASNAQSSPSAADFLKLVASRDSKTISLQEVDAFATKKFGELKKQGEQSLSMADLRGRISQADFDAANTTRGNAVPTLSQAEFLAYVDRLFKEANTVGEKTLSETELKTPAGEKLILLLH